MASKKLYDNQGTEFYPYTDAPSVKSGVVVPTNTLYDDLVAIWSKAQTAFNLASGAQEIQGALGIVITYKNSANSTLSEVIAEGQAGWSENMSIPDNVAPYAWKKTVYSWTVNNSTAKIKTTYEIVATALYPETQVMYTAIQPGVSQNLGGPSSYNTTDSGSSDKTANGVKWYYYFPGIDASASEGYMAVRHRDAGQEFPNGGAWQIHRMAQYPTQQS